MKTFACCLLLLLTAVVSAQPSVELPPELHRVLRDYEKFWTARDAAGLADLFTEDGFVLSSGKPPVRGRVAIREAYADAGGPLFLRAFASATDGATGYIIDGFRSAESSPDSGKFVLAIRKDAGGRWLIAADMDNANQRSRPPASPAPPTPPAPPAPPTPPASH